MSRVTINDIWTTRTVEKDKYAEMKKIEIVPRKMVEMIIERCRVLINAEDVQEYAQALLDKFEEE